MDSEALDWSHVMEGGAINGEQRCALGGEITVWEESGLRHPGED